ncbi:MAG: hypothetical protein IPN34_14845 [Planctomycetes bacterium]|nr:hypothetical protein [Planctomycetota bacterium]
MRKEDGVFEPEERLFRALNPAAFHEECLVPSNLPATNVSVDREKYGGSASSVLKPIERNGWGTLVWLAGSVPKEFSRSDGSPLAIAPEDSPLEENEAHAELRVRRQDESRKIMDEGDLRTKALKQIKHEIRMHLAQIAVDVVPPSIRIQE